MLEINQNWIDIQKKGGKYKILSGMARDNLVVLVSTMALESAFSTSSGVLDSYPSSLTTKVVEALICVQDWLRSLYARSVLKRVLTMYKYLDFF